MKPAAVVLALSLAGAATAQQVPSVDDVYVSPRQIGADVPDPIAPSIEYLRFAFVWSVNVAGEPELRAAGTVLQQVPRDDEPVPMRVSLLDSGGMLGPAGGALVSDGGALHLEDWSSKSVRRLDRSDARNPLLALLDTVTLGQWARPGQFDALDGPDSPWRTVPGQPNATHRVDPKRRRHLYLEFDGEGRLQELRVLRAAGPGRVETMRLMLDELQPTPAPPLLEFRPRE